MKLFVPCFLLFSNSSAEKEAGKNSLQNSKTHIFIHPDQELYAANQATLSSFSVLSIDCAILDANPLLVSFASVKMTEHKNELLKGPRPTLPRESNRGVGIIHKFSRALDADTAQPQEKLNSAGMFLLLMAAFVGTANAATQGYDSAVMVRPLPLKNLAPTRIFLTSDKNGIQILGTYSDYFHLTTATTGLNVSIVFLGSIVAMPFAGPLSDRWGRKWAMGITAVIAIIGAAIQGAAVNEAMFCIGRLIIGISITTNAVSAPAYVEMLQ